MEEGGEDRISNLPESVVSHILSCLPTKDAVGTSILSKDWKNKWTSIYNIQLDDRRTSLRGKIKNKTFVSFLERILHFTRNSRIQSFRLSCSIRLNSGKLKTFIDSVSMRGVQNFEINTYQCRGNTFVDGLYNCRSLTKLKLNSDCTLVTSLMKNGFPNLKILYLGYGVSILNDEVSNSSKVLLNFPVLEELELRCWEWRDVKSVEIKAPELIRFLAEVPPYSTQNDYRIKIDGAKLENFESCGGLLDDYITAPSVLKAVLTSSGGLLTSPSVATTLGSRARTILKGFPALELLKLSSEIVKPLIESNLDFPLPCFNHLKQLEFSNEICDDAPLMMLLLMDLLKAMPVLESLSLYVHQCHYKYNEGLELIPSGIFSRLKIVKLVGFGSLKGQFQLAEFVLKNAENLETLFVSVCYRASMPKIMIRNLLSTSPRSSTRATIVVDRPRRKRTRTGDD